MGAHETADAVLTVMEADRLRARALELVAELDTLSATMPAGDYRPLFMWAGQASYILAELARG